MALRVPKELLGLQLSFARRVQALSGMELDEVLLKYTNLSVRLGLGRHFDGAHPVWRAYLEGLRTAKDDREWTYRFYRSRRSVAAHEATRFGCFSYAISPDGLVRLHFTKFEADAVSPLASCHQARRRAELRALCDDLRRKVGLDLVLCGSSWLYNLESYRRLFPSEYLASGQVTHGRFTSMALWGQFMTHRGGLREGAAETFLCALERASSTHELDSCFPLVPISVQAPIRLFCEHFGL